MAKIAMLGFLSIVTAERLRKVGTQNKHLLQNRRLLDVDHMSMDELEKLAANPESLFGSELKPLNTPHNSDVFNQLESPKPTDYDGFSYGHLEKIASIASGHLDVGKTGKQNSLNKLQQLMKNLNGPSDIRNMANKDKTQLVHPSPYNQDHTGPYIRANHPSTVAKAEKKALVNMKMKLEQQPTTKPMVRGQLKTGPAPVERQPEQIEPVLRKARSINKKYNKLWKTRDSAKTPYKSHGTVNPSPGWSVAHMLDADFSGTDDYTIAELKKIADISGMDTAWNPSVSGSRHPWLANNRHIRDVAPKWDEMWEGFDTTPQILQ